MASPPTAPPAAPRKPYVHRDHGVERRDPYHWMRERGSKEICAYLEGENAYTKAAMADTEALQATLVEEFKQRIKQDDDTYPVRWKNYLYYERYEHGAQYPLHCRRRADSEGAGEEVMLDVPRLSEGHRYFDLDAGDVSPDERLLVYATDTEGRRVFTLRIRDLETGEDLADVLEGVEGGHAWAADSKTLFYMKQDAETLRPHQVWRHVLGTPVADDMLVYEEVDETFYCHVTSSKSERYVIIGSNHTLCDEYRLLEADDPTGEFELFTPRRRGLEHDVEHYHDGFYIRTNKDCANFSLMWAPQEDTDERAWREVVAGRDSVYLADFEVFDGHVVTEEREGGLNKLHVRPTDGSGEGWSVDFGEPTYSAWTDANLQFDCEWLRYGFSSPKTPGSLYEVNLRSGEQRLLKRQPVLGGYRPQDYATERLSVAARDGRRVPVSLVYREDRFRKDGGNPLLLYAYGAYGISSHPIFQPELISLLNRGFVYAIAHVRGGQELGRGWYEDGRVLRKENTFHDFIDCARHLVAEGYTTSDRLCAHGASAGGLIMGVIANEEPELFAALLADVPWVDCVTTMLDDTIPLTAAEYDEWGDPHEREVFDYMLAYSPYDNVRQGPRPAMLVTAGLHDSQVQYWEPAKWVARLRERGGGDALLLLKTDMEAGHGGASGRFDSYKEEALQQAFLLKVVGAAGGESPG